MRSAVALLPVLLFLGAALVTPWLMKNRPARAAAPAENPAERHDGAA